MKTLINKEGVILFKENPSWVGYFLLLPGIGFLYKLILMLSSKPYDLLQLYIYSSGVLLFIFGSIFYTQRILEINILKNQFKYKISSLIRKKEISFSFSDFVSMHPIKVFDRDEDINGRMVQTEKIKIMVMSRTDAFILPNSEFTIEADAINFINNLMQDLKITSKLLSEEEIIENLLKSGNDILAIKTIRKQKNISLVEAKIESQKIKTKLLKKQ